MRRLSKKIKPCELCGSDMKIEKHKKGGVYKRARIYWKCTDAICDHRELQEGTIDKAIRLGYYDNN